MRAAACYKGSMKASGDFVSHLLQRVEGVSGVSPAGGDREKFSIMFAYEDDTVFDRIKLLPTAPLANLYQFVLYDKGSEVDDATS